MPLSRNTLDIAKLGTDASFELARRCAELLHEKKLEEITIFQVTRAIQITDYFVIASGLNLRHLRAASDHLIREFREEGVARSGLEGYREGGWILIDFDEVVVHLFLGPQRRHYDLELLWGDCPRLDWSEPATESSVDTGIDTGAGEATSVEARAPGLDSLQEDLGAQRE